MIGRADIEGSKSDVAMNAWPPQASYPCGNFSDTSCLKPKKPEGSWGPAFTVRTHTENQDQASFCPSAPREVSVLPELALGHLRYSLTGVPPQSNSPPVHGEVHFTMSQLDEPLKQFWKQYFKLKILTWCCFKNSLCLFSFITKGRTLIQLGVKKKNLNVLMKN